MKLKTFILSLIILFTVYSIHLNFIPPYMSPRIWLILILTWFFFYRHNFGINQNIEVNKKELIIWTGFNCLLLVYSFVVTIGNGQLTSNYSVFTSVLNYFVMVFVFSWILPYYFKNEKIFCDALILATLFQSLIVLISLSESGRIFIESIQIADIERYQDRIIGLGIAGATGSIYLFTGLIANTYMLLFKSNSWKYLVSFLVIFLAISLVARTGFYLALILLLFMIFYDFKNIIRGIKRFVFLIIISLLLSMAFSLIQKNDSTNSELISYTINRLDEIFSGSESKTFQSISRMNIPTLSFETIVGTGVRKGTTASGEWIWHDSGYVQRYMGLGLIMSLLSYLSIIMYQVYLTKKIKMKEKRMFFYLIISLMMIIEIKEPFIFTLAYPFVVIVITRIVIKAQNEEIKKHYEARRVIS